MVILVIGIFLGLTIPKFRNTFSNFELDNFSKDLYLLSRYLQNSAISQGNVFCLVIDNDQGVKFQGYLISENGEFNKIPGRLGREYAAAQGISIYQAEASARSEVYFYPDAKIDNLSLCFENKNQRKICFSTSGSNIELK